jgi:hypothetical protein
MKNIEKMREEFEAAYRAAQIKLGVNSPGRLFSRGPDGEYLSVAESHAWWGWQASRESLVIELPEAPNDQRTYSSAVFCDGAKHMRNLCSNAIKAQALKVKP